MATYLSRNYRNTRKRREIKPDRPYATKYSEMKCSFFRWKWVRMWGPHCPHPHQPYCACWFWPPGMINMTELRSIPSALVSILHSCNQSLFQLKRMPVYTLAKKTVNNHSDQFGRIILPSGERYCFLFGSLRFQPTKTNTKVIHILPFNDPQSIVESPV